VPASEYRAGCGGRSTLAAKGESQVVARMRVTPLEPVADASTR
jgi:hypothetical protein